MKDVFRPSHADYTYQMKYGIRNWKGGGRASARETIGRVAAGAIAKQWLRAEYGIEIVGFVRQVHQLSTDVDGCAVTMEAVEANPSVARSRRLRKKWRPQSKLPARRVIRLGVLLK